MPVMLSKNLFYYWYCLSSEIKFSNPQIPNRLNYTNKLINDSRSAVSSCTIRSACS
jgi:hypothetical protein